MTISDQENGSDIIFQDGVPCPKTPPWPKSVSYLSLSGMPFVLLLAVYIFLQTGSYFKLILWLAAILIFAIPLRYLVCARCPYYGEHCSTLAGKVVPHVFQKQEGKSMVFGLYMDIIFFMILVVLPIADAYRAGGFLLLLLWLVLNGVTMVLLTRLGCADCPFTFCPIGKLSRLFWGRFGL